MRKKHFPSFFCLINVLSPLLFIIGLSGFCQKTSVYFSFNDCTLDERAKNTIDSLLKNNSIEKIYLKGHCDSIGSNEFNDPLSFRRVTEVKKYFVINNIP
jgi:outer membrane protein OmpA-like peptidoglycan-associated protein